MSPIASIRLGGLLGLLTALAGCSANFHTVFRKTALDGEPKTLIALDAKQRTVVGNKDKVCAEPSPDVFAVIAQSLSTGGTFAKSANPASLQAALNIAFGSAEQGTTIPRTQTVNMLRDLMYRTCERSLNKDISKLEMPIQAVRDQRLMVSVLAIEQLTGAVTPKAIAIGATGAAAQANGEAIIRVDDARKETEASTAATTKAQGDFDNLNKKNDGDENDQTCAEITTAIKENKPVTAADKKKQDCIAATTTLADAKARQARAQSHEADLRRMATTLGGSVTTSTSAQSMGGTDPAGDCCVAKVADAVREIVKFSFSDASEFLLYCIKSGTDELEGREKEQADAVKTQCTEFIQATLMQKAKEAQLAAEVKGEEAVQAQVAAANAKLEEARVTAQVQVKNEEAFARYWTSMQPVLRDPTKSKALADALKGRVEPMERGQLDCVADAATRDKAQACFLALPNSLRQKMIVGE